MADIPTLLLAVVALACWTIVLLRATRHPFGIVSPIALLSAGVLIFYVVPAIYWLLRPWPYVISSYANGLWLVELGATVQAIPFLILGPLFQRGQKPGAALTLAKPKSLSRLWLLLIPTAVGFAWRFYMMSMGSQARLLASAPTFFGSEELGAFLVITTTYYPVCYLCLFAAGARTQRGVGIVLWAVDGILCVFLLQRFLILAFVFRSLVVMRLMNIKLQAKYAVALALVVAATLSVVGEGSSAAKQFLQGGEQYLAPAQVLQTLSYSVGTYSSSETSRGLTSNAENPLLRVLDDSFLRFYDARSEAAVMVGVPSLVPYANGSTFVQVLYSLVPRFLWPEKPTIRTIHEFTHIAMGAEAAGGLNPLGTIGEFYANFGFVGMALCGAVTFLMAQALQSRLARTRIVSPLTVLMYPIAAYLLIAANYHFTERLVFTVHLLLFGALARLLIGSMRKPARRNAPVAPEPGYLSPMPTL